MAVRILQSNLNHARGAQDLFMQTFAEHDFSLRIAVEPYRVPDKHPCWAKDRRGFVAIMWRQTHNSSPCFLIEARENFVAVSWGTIAMIGIYFPPSLSRALLQVRLDRVRECIIQRCLPRPTVVAGDFNAKSATWDFLRPNQRGKAVED